MTKTELSTRTAAFHAGLLTRDGHTAWSEGTALLVMLPEGSDRFGRRIGSVTADWADLSITRVVSTLRANEVVLCTEHNATLPSPQALLAELREQVMRVA